MATFRDRPYMQFNFLVDLGDGTTDGPKAGFQEISGIGMEVTVAEYRAGNSKENSVMKITGLNKCTDVTMKRGVMVRWISTNGLTRSATGIRRRCARSQSSCKTRTTQKSCKPGSY